MSSRVRFCPVMFVTLITPNCRLAGVRTRASRQRVQEGAGDSARHGARMVRHHLPDGTAIALRRARSERLRGVDARNGTSLLVGHTYDPVHLWNVSRNNMAPVGRLALHLLPITDQVRSVPSPPRAPRYHVRNLRATLRRSANRGFF